MAEDMSNKVNEVKGKKNERKDEDSSKSLNDSDEAEQFTDCVEIVDLEDRNNEPMITRTSPTSAIKESESKSTGNCKITIPTFKEEKQSSLHSEANEIYQAHDTCVAGNGDEKNIKLHHEEAVSELHDKNLETIAEEERCHGNTPLLTEANKTVQMIDDEVPSENMLSQEETDMRIAIQKKEHDNANRSAVCVSCDTGTQLMVNCTCCSCDFCVKCIKKHHTEQKGNTVETKDTNRQPGKDGCNPCEDSGIFQIATNECNDCKELLCERCTKLHQLRRITKSHTLSKLEIRKTFCDWCTYLGVDDRMSCYYCDKCEENLCEQCFIQHQSQKQTKDHMVLTVADSNLQTETARKERPCSSCASNKYAEVVCKSCDSLLCQECLVGHVTSDSKTEHLIETIGIVQSLYGSQFAPCDYQNDGRRNEINKMVSEAKEQQSERFNKDSLQEVDIKNKEQPGKPRLDNQNQRSIDSIKLTWNPPNLYYEAYCYQIRYKEVNSTEWKFYERQIDRDNPYAAIGKLKSNTAYSFQVRMVNNEKEGPYSVQSDGIKTQKSAASRMLDYAVVLEDKGHPIVIRKVPFTQIQAARNTEIKSRRLEIGMDTCKDLVTTERTIMLVGATGSGKSTLVDGIANYVLGVNWDDNYRLSATDLEEDEMSNHQNQAVSQTRWITCYTFHPMKGSRINYTLNIIDTPGFGDTRGIERDQEIIEQIRQLFHDQSSKGIAFVDVVCFLVKAPDARLTPSQRYIFDSILSLFGKDIKENICWLVTFADGNTPPVLDALKESNLMFEPFFPFNNSGLFANNAENAVSLAPMFWEMGTNSFKRFFDHVDKITPKSLSLTKEVLDKRKELEITVENILPMIDSGLHKVDELSEEIRIFNNHQRDIEENQDFVYSVKETKQTKVDLPKGEHVTNCLTCHMTCHKRCQIAEDEQKKYCFAMNKETGVCNQCDCHWTQHKNTPYIFEFKTESVKRTYTEKLKSYNLAISSKDSIELVITKMNNELGEIELKLQERIVQVTICTNQLKEIALRPNPLSRDQYIDLLIQTERSNKSDGFAARVNTLLQLKKKSNVTKVFGNFRERYTRVRQSAKQYKNKESRFERFKSFVAPWK